MSGPIRKAGGAKRTDQTLGGLPTDLLLLASNVFMTVAWYRHLRAGMDRLLPTVVLASWGLALAGYCSAVPANRIGFSRGWSGAQLKVTQEVTALCAFGCFMVLVLGEPL